MSPSAAPRSSTFSFVFSVSIITALSLPLFSVAAPLPQCTDLFAPGTASLDLTTSERRRVRLAALTNRTIAKRLAERETEATRFFSQFGSPSPGYDVEIFQQKGGVFFGFLPGERALLMIFKDRLKNPDDALEQMFDSVQGVSLHQRYAVDIWVGERFKAVDRYLLLKPGRPDEQEVLDEAASGLMADLETLREEFRSPDMIDGFQVGHITAEGWNYFGPKGSVPLYIFAKLTVVFNSQSKPGPEALETLVDFTENHLVPRNRR